MCGIVGYVGKNNNCVRVLIDGLSKLEYRGYDSTEIAYLSNGKITTNKENGKLENLIYKVKFLEQSNLGIGHTRWATYGMANQINAHPHKVGKFTIVHNGIIENYNEIKEELVQKNYKFSSETYTEAGKEIAVATTKAYSAQVAMLSLIALKLASSKNLINKKQILEILKDVKNLPNYMSELLDNRAYYREIAEHLKEYNDIFYIGRGVDYALAMEGSLKLKEISYIHSEAYAAGELKHGTISLIEEGTPVIAIVTDEKIAAKTISNIKEVKSRGAYVIYVTNQIDDIDNSFFDKKILIPKVNDLFSPLLTIIPLQLIAYEIARFKNCNIDKPKNLAKSVTVE